MSERPLSAYAASRQLGRDRQTIERAVRHLAPDAYERGQPRWHLERIVDALRKTPEQRREAGRYRDQFSLGRNKALDGLRLMIEKQIVLIGDEPSLDKRRQMAVALAPQLAEHHALFLSTARSLGIASDDVLGIQSDLIWCEWLDEVSAAAQWQRDEGFGIAMLTAAWPDDDDEATE